MYQCGAAWMAPMVDHMQLLSSSIINSGAGEGISSMMIKPMSAIKP